MKCNLSRVHFENTCTSCAQMLSYHPNATRGGRFFFLPFFPLSTPPLLFPSSLFIFLTFSGALPHNCTSQTEKHSPGSQLPSVEACNVPPGQQGALTRWLLRFFFLVSHSKVSFLSHFCKKKKTPIYIRFKKSGGVGQEGARGVEEVVVVVVVVAVNRYNYCPFHLPFN